LPQKVGELVYSLRVCTLLDSVFRNCDRGMSKLAYILGTRVFDKRNSVALEVNNGTKLRIYLRDGYWINLLFSDFEYEPEVAFILSRVLRQPNACFVDCGANIGYWSIIASGIISEHGRVWAIEASPPILNRLVENAALNDNRFECVHAAIWSDDDETLEMISHDQRHAGSSVISRRGKRREPGYRVDSVRTLTLDTLANRFIPSDLQIVLKLDIEGAEIAALQGASNMIAKGHLLVVYEDHGNDPEGLVSQYILDELGMSVFACDGRLHVSRMSSLASIQRLKTDSRRGYNFFACAPQSEFARSLVGLAEQAPA
jgi:FkbM family methyltransferase